MATTLRWLPGGPLAVAAALVLLLAGCSPAGPGPAVSFNPSDPSITADGLKFNTKTLTVPAGVAFSLAFHNHDSAPHNVAFYSDASLTTKLFPADIYTGPGTKVYAVPAIAAVTYYFKCDVHPDMNGQVLAEPAPAGSPTPAGSAAST